MTARINKFLATLFAFAAFLFLAISVSAAAPDGAGPWADNVQSSSQGLRKDGSAVLVVRSSTSSALGVAENDTTDGNFYSLGFGGNIVLGFTNGISTGSIEVTEATALPYPDETAKVEVSENGTTWVLAGTVSQDDSVSKPTAVACVKFVRVTDTSDAEEFSDDIADGYDVDGVKLVGEPCSDVTPTPTPTPGNGCGCGGTVIQKNKTIVNTTVVSNTNTGGNSTSFNTGGINSITTGSSTTAAQVAVTGGTNTNTSTCCCDGGSTNVTISGNGVGSRNFVLIKKKK